MRDRIEKRYELRPVHNTISSGQRDSKLKYEAYTGHFD